MTNPHQFTEPALEHYRERLAICLESGVDEQRAEEIAVNEAIEIERRAPWRRAV